MGHLSRHHHLDELHRLINIYFDIETVGVGKDVDFYLSRRRFIRRTKDDFARDVGSPPFMASDIFDGLDNAEIA